MGISKKNKRKLIFQEQDFYWWIKEEFDGNGGMLEINIATEDKSFLVKYYAIQDKSTTRYLTVIGKFFSGLLQKNGNWKRFACPNFVPTFKNHGIGPKNIESILTWCYNPEKTLIEVDYMGVVLK